MLPSKSHDGIVRGAEQRCKSRAAVPQSIFSSSPAVGMSAKPFTLLMVFGHVASVSSTESHSGIRYVIASSSVPVSGVALGLEFDELAEREEADATPRNRRPRSQSLNGCDATAWRQWSFRSREHE